MAKNPVFPLYYNDLDRSTKDWTDEEFGCYVRLLIHQWAQNEIPKETQRLTRIAESIIRNEKRVLGKFTETETGMINERLEEIREGMIQFREKQRGNGSKGGRPKKEKPKQNPNKTQIKPKRKPKQNPTNNPKHNPNKSLHIEVEEEVEVEIKEEDSFGKSENLSEKKVVKMDFSKNQLSEIQIQTSIEFIYRLCKKMLTKEEVINFWEAFLIQQDGKFHRNLGDRVNHFRNWLKIQNEKFKSGAKGAWSSVNNGDFGTL